MKTGQNTIQILINVFIIFFSAILLVNISEIESPSRETWTSRKASQPLHMYNLNIINQRLGKNQPINLIFTYI